MVAKEHRTPDLTPEQEMEMAARRSSAAQLRRSSKKVMHNFVKRSWLGVEISGRIFQGATPPPLTTFPLPGPGGWSPGSDRGGSYSIRVGCGGEGQANAACERPWVFFFDSLETTAGVLSFSLASPSHQGNQGAPMDIKGSDLASENHAWPSMGGSAAQYQEKH